MARTVEGSENEGGSGWETEPVLFGQFPEHSNASDVLEAHKMSVSPVRVQKACGVCTVQILCKHTKFCRRTKFCTRPDTYHPVPDALNITARALTVSSR
jgi:hypothetical protein